MSEPFLWVKLLHILSATVLFGTGLGTAFHLYAAHRRGDVAGIAAAARSTVLADWLFTATSGIVQPVTGIALAVMAGYSLAADWLVASYALYAVALICWLRVVRLQYRMRRLAVAAAEQGAPLPPDYHRAMRQWFWLGWPAFVGLLAVFALMVFRPALW